MRKLFILAAVGCSFAVLPFSSAAQQTKPLNFYEVQKQHYSELKNKDQNRTGEDKNTLFKRLEWFYTPRVYPTGDPIPSTVLDEQWSAYKKRQSLQRTAGGALASWKYIGSDAVPGEGGGAGRLNCVEFDPVNNNMIWVGAPCGGLWRSADGGSTWVTNTDNLPNLGVTDIAIDPSNTAIMYIATGDGYGYKVGWEFWGGTYSHGVLKSTDGGATWDTTGLNWTVIQGGQVRKILVDPLNTQLLYAGTNRGIYKSADAGVSWTRVFNLPVFDLVFNPKDPETIFATTNTNIYRTYNGGSNWVALNGSYSAVSPAAIAIAVTAADTSRIYAGVYDGGQEYLYSSSNSGTTWALQGYPYVGSYGWYSLAIAASPLNADLVFMGGLNVLKSTDGGVNWAVSGDWLGWPASDYVHADNRILEFAPGTSTLFACNDGGLFRSADQGGSWVNLSNGLHIFQLYKLGSAKTNPTTFYVGAQDNGVNQCDLNTWKMVVFADGMECIVDPVNPDNVYTTTQYGALHKSVDGGQSFTDVTPAQIFMGANWEAPLAMDPADPQTLYIGGREIYKSTDGGLTWNDFTSIFSSIDQLTRIRIAQSDNDVIYAVTGTDYSVPVIRIYKTANGGATWSNISAGLPVSSLFLSDLIVSRTDAKVAWACFSGYTAGSKIYKTSDGGATWTNISGSVPNVPVNCLAYDDFLNGVYAGTDFGVYYRNDSLSDWQLYSDGLPNVMVSELETISATQKIRAATYGRGVWEGDLVDSLITSSAVIRKEERITVYPNPGSGTFMLGFYNDGVKEVKVYNVVGEKVYDRTLTPSAGGRVGIDLSHLPAGTYILRAGTGSQVVNKKLLLVR